MPLRKCTNVPAVLLTGFHFFYLICIVLVISFFSYFISPGPKGQKENEKRSFATRANWISLVLRLPYQFLSFFLSFFLSIFKQQISQLDIAFGLAEKSRKIDILKWFSSDFKIGFEKFATHFNCNFLQRNQTRYKM